LTRVTRTDRIAPESDRGGRTVRRVIRSGLVLAAIAALAVVISACGSTKTTTETSTVTTSAQTPTSTATGGGTPTTPTRSTTTAAGPSSCGPNQAFSQVTHTCVNTNPNGNPCPAGQVPMADKPICVKQ